MVEASRTKGKEMKMAREWLCTFCKKWIIVESNSAHGFDLLYLIRNQHGKVSPDCNCTGPLNIPVPPLMAGQRAPYLEGYLKPQVQLAEEKSALGVLDPTFMAVIKNDLVWLDCQLGTDGESVEIYKEIETLNERLSALRTRRTQG
jgi:hypothetical protein